MKQLRAAHVYRMQLQFASSFQHILLQEAAGYMLIACFAIGWRSVLFFVPPALVEDPNNGIAAAAAALHALTNLQLSHDPHPHHLSRQCWLTVSCWARSIVHAVQTAAGT
jgi:hypothetical protein